MKVTNHKSNLGVVVENISVNEISKEESNELINLVYKNKVVIIKGSKQTAGAFLKFSEKIGKPVPYLQGNYHHPNYPEIFVSSNIKTLKYGVARTGGYWHIDTAFQEDPTPITVLHPQVIPKTIRTTLFIDLEKAYKKLPNNIKNSLQKMNFIHSGRYKYKVRQSDVGNDISEILAQIDQVVPPVTHPSVITHPISKAKAIYVSRGFTIDIQDEHLLKWTLEDILNYVEQDEFIFEFAWEDGDIILWDNRLLAHKSGRNGDQEEETLLFRILVDDNLPYFIEE